MEERVGNKELSGLADALAEYGRHGDTMLMHVTPGEVENLASQFPGGKMPINPVTGLPEAFWGELGSSIWGGVTKGANWLWEQGVNLFEGGASLLDEGLGMIGLPDIISSGADAVVPTAVDAGTKAAGTAAAGTAAAAAPLGFDPGPMLGGLAFGGIMHALAPDPNEGATIPESVDPPIDWDAVDDVNFYGDTELGSEVSLEDLSEEELEAILSGSREMKYFG